MTKVDSWEALDQGLRRLGELEVTRQRINGDLTVKIQALKDEAAKEMTPIDTETAHIEALITHWCEGNKHEFADKRSRQFNFGEVGYRLVKSVALPRVKEKVAALIKAMKAYGLGDMIATEEKPDKDALAELEDGTLAKLGLKRTVKDSFRIVPKLEAVKGQEAA